MVRSCFGLPMLIFEPTRASASLSCIFCENAHGHLKLLLCFASLRAYRFLVFHEKSTHFECKIRGFPFVLKT